MSSLPTSVLVSVQNPYVKDLVRLRKEGAVRRKRGLFFVEGRRAVWAALDQQRARISELIVCDLVLEEHQGLLERGREKGIPIVKVNTTVFKKMADVVSPQGIAAVVEIPRWSWDEVLGAADPLLVVACGVQDPGNLGTLIRSCEAAGATALITLEGSADPFNAKVVRSTAGGLLTLPILHMSQDLFLAKVAAWNAATLARPLRLVATAAEGGTYYRRFDWAARPLALCIGNEGAGLSAAVSAACGALVSIPLRGRSESLNAAVAASILLFEAQARCED